MAGCSIQDLMSGGGFLPHVYCKKVTLENTSATDIPVPLGEGTRITLNLEILQNKKQLYGNSLLSVIANEHPISDFIFVQFVPFYDKSNINKLNPAFEPLKGQVDPYSIEAGQMIIHPPGNVYVASSHPNYKNLSGDYNSPFPISGYTGLAPPEFGFTDTTTYSTDFFSSEFWSPAAAPGFDAISLGEIFYQQGLPSSYGPEAWPAAIATSADLAPPLGTSFREEILYGEPYYVISFDYTFSIPNPIPNLGFLFYSYLNTTQFMTENTTLTSAEVQNMGQNFLIGPVNTEIIFLEGKVQTTKKQFFLPNGATWYGAVHLHVCNANPAPDGYCGDGAAMGGALDLDPSDIEYRGWMAGEKHIVDAPKLRLMQAPNYTIQDFRVKSPWLHSALGLTNSEEASFNKLSYVPSKDLDSVVAFKDIISPFQKDTKKYLVKVDVAPGLSGLFAPPAYESDSEYSKLYVTRDKDNNARGTFLIDFERLLRNNSSIYHLLDGSDDINYKIARSLEGGKLLELKVYRDRVKKRPQGKTYERYANDTAYEEPSHFVGSIRDLGLYAKNTTDNLGIKEISLKMSGFANLTGKVRCFTFKDTNVGKKTAGLYQYRIEMSFIDGTAFFLNKLLKNLSEARLNLQRYYNFSVGHYVIPGASHPQDPDDTITWTQIKPYFRNNIFDPKFKDDVESEFINPPWVSTDDGASYTSNLIFMIDYITTKLFSTNPSTWTTNLPSGLEEETHVTKVITALLSPTDGSPYGIEFTIRIVDSIINHLQKIIGSTKVNKTGSEIDDISVSADAGGTPYKFSNFYDYVVSSSEATIKEYHTFDSPLELHKALSNEDIYIDYLSASPSSTNMGEPAAWRGPLLVSRTRYKNRCRLDAIRMYPALRHSDVWEGSIPTGRFIVSGLTDTFKRTAFQYLMPSIIELSDPSEEDISYKFKNFAFTSDAISDTSINYDSYENHDMVIVALITYDINKNNVDDADLLEAYYRIPGAQPGTHEDLGIKEAYKNLFNSVGITIHDKIKHDQIFNKVPGFVESLDLCDPDDDNYQDCIDGTADYPNEFSDGDLNTENYYKQFFSDSDSIFKAPVGKTNIPYNVELPNIFKLATFVETTGMGVPWLLGDKSDLVTTFVTATEAVKNGVVPEYNSFFFLNANLVSKTQIYTGATIGGSNATPMKYDDTSWVTITADLLDALPNDQAYLCRTVLYDEPASYGLTLPYINKYFFITGWN